jgi:hypothetical protein
MKVSDHVHDPVAFPWIGSWLGSTSGPDAVAKRKNFCPCLEWNSDSLTRLARSFSVLVTELSWWLPTMFVLYKIGTIHYMVLIGPYWYF